MRNLLKRLIFIIVLMKLFQPEKEFIILRWVLKKTMPRQVVWVTDLGTLIKVYKKPLFLGTN